MGINLSTSFENDNNVQILSLPKVGDPAIAIGAGTPESPSQNAVPIRIGIQKSDADKFNDTKRIIIRLNIHSLAQPTPLSTYDYIRIRAWGNLVVNVSK